MPQLVIDLPDECTASIDGNKIIVSCGSYASLADLLSRLRRTSILEALLNDMNASST